MLNERSSLRGEATIINKETGEIVQKTNCIVRLGRLFTLCSLVGVTPNEFLKGAENSDLQFGNIGDNENTDARNANTGSTVIPGNYELNMYACSYSEDAKDLLNCSSIRVNDNGFGLTEVEQAIDNNTSLKFAGVLQKFGALSADLGEELPNSIDIDIPESQKNNLIILDQKTDNCFLRFKLVLTAKDVRSFTGDVESQVHLVNEFSLICATKEYVEESEGDTTDALLGKYKIENLTSEKFLEDYADGQAFMFSKLRLKEPVPLFGNSAYIIEYRVYA